MKKLKGLALTSALLGIGYDPGPTGSHYTTGFKPIPEPQGGKPTKYDLERIAKAQARRQRRARAHYRQHVQLL